MVGGTLMVVSGLIILAVSAFILPGIDSFFAQNVHVMSSGNATTVIVNNSTTYTFPRGNQWWNGTYPFHGGFPVPGFVAGITAFVGGIGLVSGAVVLASSIMLRSNPSQKTLWGSLVLVFSVLSFFGSGGFVVGAILGIIAGIMVLTWKPTPPAPPAATAPA